MKTEFVARTPGLRKTEFLATPVDNTGNVSVLMPDRTTSPAVHTEQLRAVNNVFYTGLVRAMKKDARNQLPWLQSKNPDVSRKDLKERHIAGLLDAYRARMGDEQAKEKFKTDWSEGDKRYDLYLQGRLDGILGGLESQKEAALTRPREVEFSKKLRLKLRLNGARGEFESAKELLSAVEQDDEVGLAAIKTHTQGLRAAVAARSAESKGDFSAVTRFREEWQGMEDMLLGQVDHMGLFLSDAEKTTPYAAHVAEKHLKRALTTLPKGMRGDLTEFTGVSQDGMSRRIAESTLSLALGGLSYVGADATAGSVSLPHKHFFDHADWRFILPFWILSESQFIYSNVINVVSQKILKRKTGISTNIAHAAVSTVTDAAGVDERASEKAAAKAQGTFIGISEIAWTFALLAAMAKHYTVGGGYTVREAAAVSTLANVGDGAFQLSSAGANHGVPYISEQFYNRRHPFGKEEVTARDLETPQHEIVTFPVAPAPAA